MSKRDILMPASRRRSEKKYRRRPADETAALASRRRSATKYRRRPAEDTAAQAIRRSATKYRSRPADVTAAQAIRRSAAIFTQQTNWKEFLTAHLNNPDFALSNWRRYMSISCAKIIAWTVLFFLSGLDLFSFFSFIPQHLQHGLLQAAEGAQQVEAQEKVFKKALPGYKFRFPEDHYSHDEFKTEWWYYTGHLESKSGKKFGFELTFFRSGVPLTDKVEKSPWTLDNVYMTHFAVTEISGRKFFHNHKICRPGVQSAGAMKDQYKVWTENWSAMLQNSKHKLKAKDGPYSIELNLEEAKLPVIHGKDGVSQKASCVGCASHYYSLTRMPVTGTITVPGEKLEVKGIAWMDHEFGSNQLNKDQVGWDWYSLQLSDGSELMLYAMRLKNGKLDPNSSGTFVNADGSSQYLSLDQYSIETLEHWKSPHTGANYPAKWRVKLPSKGIDLVISPQLPNQELAASGGGVSYWEGSCRVSGTKDGRAVSGEAYVELTGYDKAFDKRI